MDNISRWSCTNEPGVSKYALVIPRGGGDNRTAYSIEQYVSTLHNPFLLVQSS